MNDITKQLLKEKLDSNYTNEQLANYFDCGISTIKRRKREWNLVGYKTNSKPLSNKDLQFLETEANKGTGFKNACKLLGRPDQTVKKYIPINLHKKLKSNGFDNLSNIKRKSSFKNLLKATEHTAYILGYLVGDGSIGKDGTITATSKDMELIQHCSIFFNANINITKQGYYTFSSKDYRLVEKVKKATNLIPNKTYIGYNIPEWILESELFLQYFIVGLFNADGWVYKNKYIELGIEQHINQESFLQEINLYLDWPEYKYNTFKLQTKNTNKVSIFSDFYCINPYALKRKSEILLRYSLTNKETY